MKNILSILLLLITLSVTSCTTTSAPIIRSSVTTAAIYALSKQKSPERRAALAGQINTAASAISAMADPDATGADITAAVLAATGTGNPDLVLLASAAGIAFDVWRSGNPGASNTAQLQAIADDLVRVSAPFLTPA